MSDLPIEAVIAHARDVPVDERERLAAVLRSRHPRGSVLLETCHRVELYGRGGLAAAAGLHELPAGTRTLHGEAAAEHLVALVVGLRSAIVAEDQLLHQVRLAVDAARADGPLPVEIDRLFDQALHAGRFARSWLPPGRPSLADLALDMLPMSLTGCRVLVVGAGEMGRIAARSALARGSAVQVASRTPERAAALARQLGVQAASFDPDADHVRAYDAIVLALRGRWAIDARTASSVAESETWLIDLSAPPAIPPAMATALGKRLIAIDDLARAAEPAPADRLVARLAALAGRTLAAYLDWHDREPQRRTAREMARRAEEARAAELDALWRRLPAVAPEERREIERMAHHLAERILREPLERLGRDADGRHDRAARELFGL